MKKHFTLLAVLGLILFVLPGCSDDDKQSYPPTWQGFLLSPARPMAGDSLTVRAVQEEKGHLINATEYTWTLSCTVCRPDGTFESVAIVEEDHTNYDGLNSGDPVHRFLIPSGAQGRATVNFMARYNYSARGIEFFYQGDYSRPAGMSGSILSQSGQFGGGATGSVSFQIAE